MVICFFFSGWDEVLEKTEKLNYFRWHHPFEVSNGFPLEIDSMQKLIKTRKMGARNGGTQWAHQVGLLSGSASRPLRAFSGESIWIRVSWSAWHLWEIGWFSGMCGKRLDQTISWITFVMQSCGGPIGPWCPWLLPPHSFCFHWP